ncbi:unnamed protein product [Clavelina lepadiformis]|uniref:Uncharacterized protein n=1 Tax=Clavelina lepadiformis TaxID=159417 RepID=A0ABP0FEM7_CLALP
MTQVVLPAMVKRKRGLVLNLSSFAAVKPVKNYAMYSATKKFVDYFAQALSYEYESKGITIQGWIWSQLSTDLTQTIGEARMDRAMELEKKKLN